MELVVLRTYTMGGSLKGWGTKYGLQALHSSGRSWELEVPSWLYGTVCVGVGWGGEGSGLWWQCVSAFPIPSKVDICLFPEGVGVTQLVSEFLSETIAPCCIFDVSIRWWEFRALYVTILVDPSSQFIISLFLREIIRSVGIITMKGIWLKISWNRI